jgi:16S rRNA (uracil1498-N3)-methyltransferase
MSLHRFYLPPAHCQGSELILSEAEAHHALHVLRVAPGQRVAVLDGEGHEHHCEVRATDRRTVTLRLLQRNTLPPLPYQVTLLQAIPKGKTMDLIVQKATELGVYRIVPLLSERIALRLTEAVAAAKTEKWRATAIEAVKQCGSAWLPRVEAPIAIRDFLAVGERLDLSLIASLQPGSRHPRERFQTHLAESGGPPKSLGVWVGPEGDFTPAEIHAITASGALPVSLGQLILRTETAAIYCLSVVNYELQAQSDTSSGRTSRHSSWSSHTIAG